MFVGACYVGSLRTCWWTPAVKSLSKLGVLGVFLGLVDPRVRGSRPVVSVVIKSETWVRKEFREVIEKDFRL